MIKTYREAKEKISDIVLEIYLDLQQEITQFAPTERKHSDLENLAKIYLLPNGFTRMTTELTQATEVEATREVVGLANLIDLSKNILYSATIGYALNRFCLRAL